MKKTRHRTSLTLNDKIAILNDLENNMTNKEIEIKYNICSATVYGIIRSKSQLLARLQDSKSEKKYNNPLINNLQTSLNTKYDINFLVLEFYKECMNRNITISGSLLQQQARFFAKCVGIEDFKGSNGWLDRFQSRYNIYFKPQNFPMLSSEAELIKNKTIPFRSKGSFKEDIEEVRYFVLKNIGLPYKKYCNEESEEEGFLAEDRLQDQNKGLLESQKYMNNSNEKSFVRQQENQDYNISHLDEDNIIPTLKHQENGYSPPKASSQSIIKSLEAVTSNLPDDDSQPKPSSLLINAEAYEDTLKKLQVENNLQNNPAQVLEDLENIEILIEELENLQPLVDTCLGTCEFYKECLRKAKLKRIALRYLSSKTKVV
ncbi:hypothetical protein SteCoe_37129 [Stentor coeruleus]|uniref:HTH CENPB-type domain-containing protein n=1 Tax=Stentor coeruleus TaxID=5963 RepID=A0A1R2ANL6_9CILI|nr:hypothetical protein SteCoe_37129 [Stentor coeruleus]